MIINLLFVNSGLFLVCITLAGLVVGSFLSVVIHRFAILLDGDVTSCTKADRHSSALLSLWWPKSFCGTCGRPIPIYWNIPLISYLLLGGVSRCCHHKIPLFYPLLECLTAGLFLAFALHMGPGYELLLSLILVSSLLALAFIDFFTLILPNSITLTLLVAGLVINRYSLITSFNSAILGMVGGFLFFFILSEVTLKIKGEAGIGGGDLKMVAMLGAWLGWQLLPVVVLIAASLGTVISFIYLLSARKSLQSKIPFGPFLAFGGIMTLLFRTTVS